MNRRIKRESTRSGVPTPAEQHGAGVFLQERLAHYAWKETLADLIPGLTHDFNNVLTGVLALSEAYRERRDGGQALDEGLSLVRQKAQDTSQLIQQLARLCQEGPGKPSYVDLNSMATEVVDLLCRVLPRRIEINTRLHSRAVPVYADGVEMRRVLLGLTLNFAQATSGSGKLQIRTSIHQRVAAGVRFQTVRPRLPATCLSMLMTAAGLTTEPLAWPLPPGGQGTEAGCGAAVAMAHARLFVESSHGAVSVQTKPGGTAMVGIWLPEADFTEAPGPTT